MRIPFWTTGLPQAAQQLDFVVPAGNDPNVILDLTEIPEDLRDRSFVVTLFALAEGSGSFDTVNVGLQDDEDNIYELFTGSPRDFSGGQKIVDRFPLRGSLRMLAGVPSGYGGDPAWFYGYYELDGTEPGDVRFRPPEPVLGSVGDNQFPFTYTPVAIDSNISEQAVHAFSNVYLDETELYVAGYDPGGLNGTRLIIVDGVDSVTIPVARPEFRAFKFFEKQPFRAASTANVGGRAPGIHLQTVRNDAVASAWGNFKRF